VASAALSSLLPPPPATPHPHPSNPRVLPPTHPPVPEARAPPPPAAPALIRPIHKRRIVPAERPHAPAPVTSARWLPAEPAVQITLPAETMFAPGAVPQGVSFNAELVLAADGSAQRIRLHP